MKRLLTGIAAALALTVSACTLPSFSVGQAPAPLAATTIDDSALMTAWKSFDVSLDAINLAIDAKLITPGSPGAVRLADAIDAVTAALSAAESAAAAGSTTDYAAALAKAKQALTEMRAAIAALKGK